MTAKVLETAALKSPKAETGFVLTPPPKQSTLSDSSSPAGSMAAHRSPAASLSLSTTSMEHENQDDTYIMLDECFSGSSNVSPKMSTSSATPSPGNTLDNRNPVAVPVEYMNLVGASDGKTMDEIPPRYIPGPGSNVSARRSTDAVSEGAQFPMQPENEYSADAGIWEFQFAASTANPEYMQSESVDSHLAPAVPARIHVSDVEYDVPSGASIHGSAVPPAPSTVHGSPAAPPQPHMAVLGRLHRYVNTAPAPVPMQTPMSSTTQKNYAELSAANRIPAGQALQSSANSSLPPPKAHGSLCLVVI